MTSTLPIDPKPGDIATPDGKIMCRDMELHEFGYFTVSYEQAQVARQYGWGCRAGVVLDGEHDDEWSWEHAEEERRSALENGEEPPAFASIESHLRPVRLTRLFRAALKAGSRRARAREPKQLDRGDRGTAPTNV